MVGEAQDLRQRLGRSRRSGKRATESKERARSGGDSKRVALTGAAGAGGAEAAFATRAAGSGRPRGSVQSSCSQTIAVGDLSVPAFAPLASAARRPATY